jgi:hypothetical protein
VTKKNKVESIDGEYLSQLDEYINWKKVFKVLEKYDNGEYTPLHRGIIEYACVHIRYMILYINGIIYSKYEDNHQLKLMEYGKFIMRLFKLDESMFVEKELEFIMTMIDNA